MAETTQNVDLSGLDSEVARKNDNDQLKYAGVNGDRLIEPVPSFIQTESEHVISNSNNAWIVLGRDRCGSNQTGYGGRGDTQAASVDIVCGRMAKSPNDKAYVDPDFKIDAARVYISQKTDIDANFGIAEGVVGSNPPIPSPDSRPMSGIVMKADGVRLCARDGGIKLVTGLDSVNSQGKAVSGGNYIGVDLIAGNDDRDMQPLVKGENMMACMKQINEDLKDLAGQIDFVVQEIMTLQSALALHTHISFFPGGPTTPSLDLMPTAITGVLKLGLVSKVNMATFSVNRASFEHKFLEANTGGLYICSEYNHTN